MSELLKEISDYWTDRAEGYSRVNKDEFGRGQDRIWLAEILKYLPAGRGLKILDIGTGPGFLAILLAKAGFQVTAVDYVEAMLSAAEKNAGMMREKIFFRRMDAQKLEFENDSFDVVISRNLTWNLEEPEQAYREWRRVLKKGGVLLNFDANWYLHLYDREKRRAYETDRKRVKQAGLEDHYTCTDIDRMEEIARKVPLSRRRRPEWDVHVIEHSGMHNVRTDMEVWKRVWSEIEKINYRSTPMFLIEGVK